MQMPGPTASGSPSPPTPPSWSAGRAPLLGPVSALAAVQRRKRRRLGCGLTTGWVAGARALTLSQRAVPRVAAEQQPLRCRLAGAAAGLRQHSGSGSGGSSGGGAMHGLRVPRVAMVLGGLVVATTVVAGCTQASTTTSPGLRPSATKAAAALSPSSSAAGREQEAWPPGPDVVTDVGLNGVAASPPPEIKTEQGIKTGVLEGSGRKGRVGQGETWPSGEKVFSTEGVDELHKLHNKGKTPLAADEHPPLTEAEMARERKRIRYVFNRLDTDGNGTLELAEFDQELRRLGLPTSRSHLRALLDAVGAQEHVDFEAFFRYCMNRERQLREAFDAMDNRHDGQLCVDEIRQAFHQLGYALNHDQAETLLQRMDKSESGRIEWHEWREFLLLLPSSNIDDWFRYWSRAAIIGDEYSMPADLEPDDALNHGRWYKHLIAGGVAGAVSRTCTAPLDRIKLVLQSQAAERKLGISQCAKELYREGGMRSLWRGNGVNVIKIAPETAIKFFAFEQAKKMFEPDESGNVTVYQRLIAGSLAGVASQTSIFPLEVLKTRLATGQTGQYRGISHCARTLLQSYGLSVFYRGLTPSLLGVIPYAGIDLAVYETLKVNYMQNHHRGDGPPSPLVWLMCGVISSSCGQLASYPLALVRTRMQINDKPTTMAKEFQVVIRSGGYTALYRGIIPNYLKVVPAVSISYVIYERTKRFLGLSH